MQLCFSHNFFQPPAQLEFEIHQDYAHNMRAPLASNRPQITRRNQCTGTWLLSRAPIIPPGIAPRSNSETSFVSMVPNLACNMLAVPVSTTAWEISVPTILRGA